MREVSKEEFYKIMGSLDVHPSSVRLNGRWVTEWKKQDPRRRVIGWTYAGLDGSTESYHVADHLVLA